MELACDGHNRRLRDLRIGARREYRDRQRGNRRNLRLFLLREHARHVALRYVRHFMRHHAGQFGLALRGQDQARVDADKAAGQRERVDLRIHDQKEIELLARVRARRDELVAQRVQIIGYLGVVRITGIGADLAHDALAQPALDLRRKLALRHVAQVGQALAQRQRSRAHE